ncbi:hypothetical protein SPI_05551 [Niveomyces insectorum RCEF 264]|uniref:Uncharacterized protein n=1 Tax=Niveomyces insectorum RCEF 264 TaxID=1081102 RepID=A0A167TBN7_9HYPO|nr:hypothetical protein SPI_05551 [Niveomyces insectorum RCEF 264]
MNDEEDEEDEEDEKDEEDEEDEKEDKDAEEWIKDEGFRTTKAKHEKAERLRGKAKRRRSQYTAASRDHGPVVLGDGILRTVDHEMQASRRRPRHTEKGGPGGEWKTENGAFLRIAKGQPAADASAVAVDDGRRRLTAGGGRRRSTAIDDGSTMGRRRPTAGSRRRPPPGRPRSIFGCQRCHRGQQGVHATAEGS